MKIPIDTKLVKKKICWVLEELKPLARALFSKKVLQGSVLVFVAFFSWKYTDFFKLPDECYKAQPGFNTTLSINHPNMRWEEFKGLEMRGLVKTLAEDGKNEVVRSYDMLTGKPAEEPKKYVLKGFLNSYDMKFKGCVESVTVFAKIQTLSGSKAILNDSIHEVKLEQKFLDTKKKKESRRKIENKKCKVELTVNPIDPMAQTAQVPTGNITMSCG